MPTTLVDVTVKVPKEFNDVRVALVELVKDVKAGKDVGTIAAENLPTLLAAIAGADQIPTEFREELAKSTAAAGLLGGEVVGAFLG